MVDLGIKYNSTYDGIPPRLGRVEIEIWSRWRDEALNGAKSVWFDVGLGDGAPIPKGTPPAYAKMWRRNTQKRADVIIEYSNSLWIVEIRSIANPNVIGRLLVYEKLWKDANPLPHLPVQLVVVSDTLEKETALTAKSLGIKYIRV